MRAFWQKFGWIATTVVGSAMFALGFALFLQPNDLNPGGISGLTMAVVELTGFGSVGSLTILINLPLFILGGVKIGKEGQDEMNSFTADAGPKSAAHRLRLAGWKLSFRDAPPAAAPERSDGGDSASNYSELIEALETIIAEGTEMAAINVADYPTSALERG